MLFPVKACWTVWDEKISNEELSAAIVKAVH